MPLELVRNDITLMKVDAIVNAANETLLGGGGVDGAIHRAAGPDLLLECRTLGGCKTGKAKITGGYKLPAKYVIHTVGPIYKDGMHGEEQLLESCYRESLALAVEHGCETVAFPLISAGAYGYPKQEAFKVATRVICDFLLENEMRVYLVLFDRSVFTIGAKLFSDIRSYVDDRYVDRYASYRRSIPTDYQMRSASSAPPPVERRSGSVRKQRSKPESKSIDALFMLDASASSYEDDLRDMLRNIDESFSEMLLRKIDERGISDVECYKRANIDRKLFSKIRSDVNYRPSKRTVLALAISLKLSLEETEEMLKKAGFALSDSNKFDIIIEFFIKSEIYDIFLINEALLAFDQSLLGG